MISAWNKSRPFVFAIGGHMLVLTLFCVDWSHARLQHAGLDTGARPTDAIEATLVTGPSPSEIAPAKSPQIPLPTPPVPPDVQRRSIPHDTPDHLVVRYSKAQLVDPLPLQLPNDIRSQARSDQRVQPPTDAESPSTDVPQEPTEVADDPYAEMRRQRAEAEHQHQIDEMNLLRMHEQQTAIASSNVPHIPIAPPDPLRESREAASWFINLQPSTITLDFSGSWTFSGELRSTRCSFTGFQSPNDNRVSDAWIDCLMNPADVDTVDQATRLIEE